MCSKSRFSSFPRKRESGEMERPQSGPSTHKLKRSTTPALRPPGYFDGCPKPAFVIPAKAEIHISEPNRKEPLAYREGAPGHNRQCSALLPARDSQAPLGWRAFMLERGKGQAQKNCVRPYRNPWDRRRAPTRAALAIGIRSGAGWRGIAGRIGIFTKPCDGPLRRVNHRTPCGKNLPPARQQASVNLP